MTRFARFGLVVMLAAVGCGGPSAKAPVTPVAKTKTAEELLSRVFEVYANADTYRDQGVVRLSFESPAGVVRNEHPLALKFVRPNKLQLTAYRTSVVSDGRRLLAQIKDETTQDVDGQVVLRPAPTQLQLADLTADALLYDTLVGRLQRNPIQLELLLDQSGLKIAATQPGVSKLLEPEKLDGVPCQRVEISAGDGATILWIDEKSLLIRRVEYPAKQLFPELAADESVRKLQLVADLNEPAIDRPLSDNFFAIKTPEGAKVMRTFVVPPKPLPTELFGKRPKAFAFAPGSDAPLTQEEMQGKPHVLLWFNDDPVCEAALRQFDAVRKELEKDDQLVFRAVCIVPEQVSTAAVHKQLLAWEVETPWVRDAKLVGRDVFKIAALPALTVFDADGKVQIFDQQVGTQLAQQLPVILERVVKGEDLAAEVIARAEREQQAYQQEVARGGPEPAQVVALERAALRSASEPKHWKLTERFRSKSLSQPGNILITDDAAKFFVLDGGRHVAEFGGDGQLIARHELDLPAEVGVTFLRSAAGKDGNRLFAAGAPLGGQAFVFNDQWKRILSYPPTEQRHDGIRDVRLFDLDGKDGPEVYVGFWSLLGVHALSLDGETLWRQREFATALSLATSAAKNDLGWRQLLVAGENGTLLAINRAGHADPPLRLPGTPALQIANARFDAAASPYGVLSYESETQLIAVGFTADWKESWRLALPPGAHANPIEFCTSGPAGWLIAGADGGLHLVADDGAADDWGVGVTLTGIGLGKFGDDHVVIAAGNGEVVGWTLTAK